MQNILPHKIPSENIDPKPPQYFLNIIYDYYYNADPNSHETYIKWVSEQPIIWMNHDDTIRAASEGYREHNIMKYMKK